MSKKNTANCFWEILLGIKQKNFRSFVICCGEEINTTAQKLDPSLSLCLSNNWARASFNNVTTVRGPGVYM